MRVIAGTAKRLQLKTLDGMETRPTTDRIKETLFNMIAPSVFGSVFLDLFAGSEQRRQRGCFCRKESKSDGLCQRKFKLYKAF